MADRPTAVVRARVSPSEHAAWQAKAAAAGEYAVRPAAAVIRNSWRLSLSRWSSSKYTSAVIAWSPEDRPTDAQIEAVLDEFYKTAWAGLDADRYSWTAVLHREQGGGSPAVARAENPCSRLTPRAQSRQWR